MQIIKEKVEILDYLKDNIDITYIPTMGNLHKGHVSLLKKGLEIGKPILVSIFINPLQFNDASDYKNYPITLEKDIEILKESKCDCLYIPDKSILNDIKEIKASKKSQYLCGHHRPGHFDGVLTILNKFFILLKPSHVIFGLKDFQQYMLVKEFIKPTNSAIDIIGVETERDENGLALSSRNGLLSQKDLNKASLIYKTLLDIKNNSNNLSYDFLNSKKNFLIQEGFEIDYLESCNEKTLQTSYSANNHSIIVAIAARIGGIRLIDNIRLN